jgi:hypothetical protein
MLALSPVRSHLEQQLREDFPACVDALVGLSQDIAEKVAQVQEDTGFEFLTDIYWNPCSARLAPLESRSSFQAQQVKAAESFLRSSELAGLLRSPITHSDRADWWVKVSYSPTLRTAGEVLQFLPSDTIPGFGGRPIASTLATGILGAGLGYAGGGLLDDAAGDHTDKKNKRRWAILGGLAGAGVGATPGLMNLAAGKKFNDLNILRGSPRDGWGSDKVGAVSSWWQKVAGPFSQLNSKEFPLIRKNQLGNVVWGTDPQLAAMTVGLVHSADRMPGGVSDPNIVTPHQVGLLGMLSGAAGGGVQGYLVGNVVGKTLGALTGLDQDTQRKIRHAGLGVGVLNSVVPRLFNTR